MSDQERRSQEAALASAVDSLVASFEDRLKSNDPPSIEDYLRVAPIAGRDDLFRRLLSLTIEAQSGAGVTIEAETWRRRFPDYAAEIERTLGAARAAEVHDTAKSSAAYQERTVDFSPPTAYDADATRALDASKTVARDGGSSEIRERTTKFGDYELLDEIARGGMGVVYRARQAKLNRIVAIKMILAGQLASDEDVQRFYSEAEAAARLDHPGIVPIYEVGEAEGRHFFSMGFVDGASLHDEVAKGPIPQRRAAELVRSIAEAVEYAHQRGIVHRDLKPRNILLASDGRPKVTDFGLAKRADSGVELTVSGQVLGTPGYMPPEQAKGRLSEVGPRSDVYSLGGVLYFLLVERPPFQGTSLTDTLTQVLESPPAPPRSLDPSIDRDLETICLKCLEKNPSHRYGSAQELADELGRYLAGEPVRARRLGPVTRTVRWIRRRPLAAALIGSLATLLIVLAISGTAGSQFVARLRTSELERQLEEGLAAAEATPQFLTRIDALLANLRPRDPESAKAFGDRADRAFAEALRRTLRRPNMDPAAIAEAESAIALLKSRDAEIADSLTAELDRRRSDWQPVFRLAAPFANADDVFPPEIKTAVATSEPTGETLRAAAAGKPFVRALSKTPSAGSVQLAAQFDGSWREAPVVGVLLEADAATGYQFVIEPLPVTAANDEEAQRLQEMSLRERLLRDGAVVAVIRRNGDPLVRRTIDAADLPDGPLKLTASRESGTIRLHANSLPPLSFVDPFPLRTRGVFGVLWPANAGLLSLQASRRPTPEAKSPLEHGDESFETGDYASALEQYELQELASDDVTIRQECQFKQGMSLFELGRYEEAATTFQELSFEPGDRWPPLAGARLWALRLRQHRQEEADGAFDYLSSKYDFARFAPLIPTSVRDEIAAAYKTHLYEVSEALRFDPDRVVEVQRAAAVDRYFSEDGRGDPMVQIDVARAFSLMGDLESAVLAAEPVARDTRHSTVFRHYVRFLRLSGDAERARYQLDEFLRRNPIVSRWDVFLAIERARIYAALGDWTLCEKEVDELYRRQRTSQDVSPNLMAYAALIKGELLDRRGSHNVAQAVRREAYLEAVPVIERSASSMTDVLHVMILGSLCEEMDDATVRRLFGLLFRQGSDNALIRQAQAMVDPVSLAQALREMWRSPLGRRYAEAFAFETIALNDRVKVPLCLAAVEYVDQTSMRGEMTLAQEEVLFETISSAADGMLQDGSIQLGQVVQLALTWKGQSGLIGWGAVAPTLNPQIRAGFAYVFAHRYVALGKKDQAIEFLRTAESDAPEGHALKRLAPLDRTALENDQGFLAIRSDVGVPVKLAVTVAGASNPIEFLAQDGAEIPAPAGDATVAIVDAPPGVALARTNVRVAPGGRTAIDLRAFWAPADGATILRGLVPRPSSSAVGARWQIVYRDSTRPPLDVAWSGDGERFAIAWDDGYVRIYPKDGVEPTATLLAPQGLTQLRWAPSADRILAAGTTFAFYGWDAATGGRSFYEPSQFSHSAVAWRADARQFASLSPDYGRQIGVRDAEGGLLHDSSSIQSGSEFVAISPDGLQAVVRCWRDDHAALQFHRLPATPSASDPPIASSVARASKVLTGPNEGEFLTGAFSPDGRFFVAGSHTSQLSLWKTDDWSRQRIVYEDHWIHRLGWFADSRRFYALLADAPTTVFDAAVEPPAIVGRVPTPGVSRGDVSPDGATIVYATGESTIRRVRVEDGASETFGQRERRLLAVAVSPGTDPRIAVAISDDKLLSFDDRGRQIATTTIPDGHWIGALAWSPDGETLAGVTGDRRVRFWSRDGEPAGEFDVAARLQPPTLAWNRDGSAAYVVAEAGSLVAIDRRSGEIRDVEGPERLLTFADSNEGKRAAANFEGGLAILADGSEKIAMPALPEGGSIRHLAWSADAATLALIDHRGNVWIANPLTDPAHRLPIEGNGATALAWSPAGTRLVTAHADGRLLAWNPETRESLSEISSPSLAETRGVVWIDEHRLAVAGLDGVLRLATFLDDELAWDTATLTLPNGGWARFSASGEALDSAGDVDGALRYVVETPEATLDWLAPAEFRKLLAERHGTVADRAGTSADYGNAPPANASSEESLDFSPAKTTELATIDDDRIAEASGLATCSSRPDALWFHNDSGSPELFLVDFDGKTVAHLSIPSARCFDWEDCTTVRREGKNYLLVGDVGDNFVRRERTELFLVAEPDAADLASRDLEAKLVAEWTLNFEDGPHDCEAIAYDAERGVLLLLTKELERECGLYEAKLDFDSREPTTARRIASHALSGATSMDLSPDGRRLAVLTASAVWEFDREPGTDWPTALSGVPRVYALPAAEQFEALVYGADGRTLFVASEGIGQKLLGIAPETP